MKAILGIVLIVAGVALFISGLNRRDSIAGQADKAVTSIANNVDGGARTTRHLGYMIGGGAMVLAGIGVMASGRNRVTR